MPLVRRHASQPFTHAKHAQKHGKHPHAHEQVGKIYSFNEGNMDLWDESVQKYMTSLKDPKKWDGKPYSARYIGSLVGDFHRTLLYGGIYGYPGGWGSGREDGGEGGGGMGSARG